MTIQKDGGMYHVLCDQCSDSDELVPDDEEFADAVTALKEMGWTPFHDGEWKHLCATCKDMDF